MGRGKSDLHVVKNSIIKTFWKIVKKTEVKFSECVEIHIFWLLKVVRVKHIALRQNISQFFQKGEMW